MKKNSVGLVLLLALFSCSKDETKTQDLVATRPTVPILSPTVQIGTQVWMTRNLNVSRYSDGTPIPQVTDLAQWGNLTTGAWCYYNNSATNGATYGKLYNWYAVAGIYNTASLSNPALRKKLAPTGWHVPTDEEWSTLINYIDPNADAGNTFPNTAGGKMKTTGTIHTGTGLWYIPNAQASNASGFSGLPGGDCGGNGRFFGIGYFGYWWSASELKASIALFRTLDYSNGNVGRYGNNKESGFSVRCLRD